jgi:hypothetical protein
MVLRDDDDDEGTTAARILWAVLSIWVWTSVNRQRRPLDPGTADLKQLAADAHQGRTYFADRYFHLRLRGRAAQSVPPEHSNI